jgi:hypothetical protein
VTRDVLLALSLILCAGCGRLGFEALGEAGEPPVRDAGGSSSADGGLVRRDAGEGPPHADASLLGDASQPASDGGAPRVDADVPRDDGGEPATPPNAPVPAGLILWLDGSDETSVDAPAAVARWSDLSGSGHHLVQVDAPRRPALVSGVLNGRSVLRFDGADDFLSLTNDGAFDSSDLTVVLLVSPRWTAHPGGNPSPFGIRRASMATRVSIHMDGNKANVHSWNDNGQSFAPYSFEPDQFYLLEFVWSSGVESHYIDGSFVNSAQHALSTNQLQRPVQVGAAEAEVENWPGDIAELMVWSRALDDTERMAVEQHIAQKWGVGGP